MNLLNVDNAAINKLGEIERTTGDGDTVNEIPQANNPDRETRGQILYANLSGAMGLVRDHKNRAATGEVNSTTCESKSQADSACLKFIIDSRLAQESSACKAFKNGTPISFKTTKVLKENEDSENFMPLKELISRKRLILNNEVALILKIMGGLKPECVPKDWFGTITVYERMAQETLIEVPPSYEGDKGSRELAKDKTIRFGRITYKGDLKGPNSFWIISGEYSDVKTGGGLTACKSEGLKSVKADKNYDTSLTITVKKHDNGAPLTSEISIGDADSSGKLIIDIKIPTAVVQAEGESFSLRTSACPNDDIKEVTSMIVPNFTFDGRNEQLPAVYFKGNPSQKIPERISGSILIDQMPFFKSTPKMAMSHTVQIHANLYKMQ